MFGIDQQIPQLRERETGEMFESMTPSKRVLCTSGSCRIRVDRAIEKRSTGYGNALQFAQNERYLTEEDIDII